MAQAEGTSVGMEKPGKHATTDYYQSLHELNLAFGEVLRHTERLPDVGLCRSKATKICPSLIQELQSEINAEFLGPLHTAEMHDWSRHGKVRQKWEKFLKGTEPRHRRKHKPRCKKPN
jgi:hypothetical protein